MTLCVQAAKPCGGMESRLRGDRHKGLGGNRRSHKRALEGVSIPEFLRESSAISEIVEHHSRGDRRGRDGVSKTCRYGSLGRQLIRRLGDSREVYQWVYLREQ